MTVRRVKPTEEDPTDEEARFVDAWQKILDDWPAQCFSKAEQKARRAWRKRAVALLIATAGIPTAMRCSLWGVVLAAAAESAPLNVRDEVGWSSGVDHPPGSSEESDSDSALDTPPTVASSTVESPRGGVGSLPPGGVGEISMETPVSPVTPAPSAAEPPESGDVEYKCETPEQRRPVVLTSSSLSAATRDEPARPDSQRRASRVLTSPSSCADVVAEVIPRQIALDVPRTYTLSPIDSASLRSKDEQTRLQSLLNEFARTASPALRYCQGMNFLGATILRVFEDDSGHSRRGASSTAVAFRGLMALVKPLYVPEFSGLREMVSVAGALLPRFAPNLASLLQAEGLDLMPITSAWCLTFFASTSMDDSLVLTCWDFLLLGTPTLQELVLDSFESTEVDEPPWEEDILSQTLPSKKTAKPRSWRRRLRSATNRRRPGDLCATTERHVMLLRLCLVFLRLGEERMTATDRLDLESFKDLLGSTQDSRRLYMESELRNSSCNQEESCFPATSAALCEQLAKTTIDNQLLHSLVKKHRSEERTRRGSK